MTDESAQKTTLEVSSSIGIIDLKFIQSADLINTPEMKYNQFLDLVCIIGT